MSRTLRRGNLNKEDGVYHDWSDKREQKKSRSKLRKGQHSHLSTLQLNGSRKNLTDRNENSKQLNSKNSAQDGLHLPQIDLPKPKQS